jgi:hypothetical protein
MRLNEIVNVDTLQEPEGDFSEERFAAGKEELGSGQTARVFKSEDPNTVTRLTYVRGKNDPYLQFIRLIQKHSDNPYFPRIYDARLYPSPEHGRYVYRLMLNMERLVPVRDERTIDAAEGILRRIGVLPPDQDLRKPWLKSLFRDKRQEMIANSKDPKFVEALKLLDPLLTKFGVDLHNKNIMLRLTGAGPQLVLLDPLVPKYTHPPYE